ncbi:MAG: RNA methyltransferase [Acidobacteriaceae bacterium]|nr:RNA methyltransferase [Acidobacteriaceae bacterium]
MTITSAKNPLLQDVRHAAAAGRRTDDEGLIVIEGPHLIEEALRGCWSLERILVTPEARGRYSDLLRETGAEIVEVSARAFASMTATENSQQVVALVRARQWDWTDLLPAEALVVVLDTIQDPGNAGTVMRSAEAFGATGVVFLKGSVHVANGKLLRATAGSIFRLPFLEGITAAECLAALASNGVALYGLRAPGVLKLAEADLRSACAIAVGSEGSGLSSEISSGARSLEIPATNVESLNAAVACSIALYAAQQQRRLV